VANVSFIFLTSPNIKPEEKWGGHGILYPPPEKLGGTRPPPNFAHVNIKFILAFWKQVIKLFSELIQNYKWFQPRKRKYMKASFNQNLLRQALHRNVF